MQPVWLVDVNFTKLRLAARKKGDINTSVSAGLTCSINFLIKGHELPIRWHYCWVCFNPVILVVSIYISTLTRLRVKHTTPPSMYTRSYRRANWQSQVSSVLCSWLCGSCNKEQCCTCHGRMGHLIIVLLDQFGWYGWNWVQLITRCTSLAWSGLHLRGVEQISDLNDECLGTPGLC